MHASINEIATAANASSYDASATRDYVDGAPHIKHAALRRLYQTLAAQVYDRAKRHSPIPTVLDLGAGEGSATMPFLELGARVTAVDVSSSQLDALRQRCERFGGKLDIRNDDVQRVLKDASRKYDIVVANSFLHHVPDYVGMLRDVAGVLAPQGQFFSFQDPLRYDSIGRLPFMFTNVAYLSWRLFKPDALGGIVRRLRRARGIYRADSVHDNAEYHVVRNGVDQDAVARCFRERGFDCITTTYFSTQSRLFQRLGELLGVKNTFAFVAQGPGA